MKETALLTHLQFRRHLFQFLHFLLHLLVRLQILEYAAIRILIFLILMNEVSWIGQSHRLTGTNRRFETHGCGACDWVEEVDFVRVRSQWIIPNSRGLSLSILLVWMELFRD